jgi:hypothetical protein
MKRSIMLGVAMAAAGGCSGKKQGDGAASGAAPGASKDAPAAPIDAAPVAPPPVTFAVRTAKGVDVYETGAGGLRRVHAVATGAMEYDSELVWAGPDALYARGNDGVVARVTGDAAVPIPLPPARTWTVPHQKGERRFSPPNQHLVATAAGELWLGRCEWGDPNPEAPSCNEWAYARILPAATPPPVQREAPAARAGFAAPAVTPPASPVVAIALERLPDAGPDDRAPGAPRTILRCTDKGRTIEYPAGDERDEIFMGIEAVTWLSADPPLFAADAVAGGFAPTTHTAVFEGCTAVVTGAQLVYGPRDVVAVLADGQASIRWHGRELGKGTASWLEFAPAP